MRSSLPPPYNGKNQTLLEDKYNIFSDSRWPSSRRTANTSTTTNSSPSFSSSSTAYAAHSSSSPDDSPPLSPFTPLPQFTARIPFAWESHPGIPKKQIRQTRSEQYYNPWNSSNSRTSRSLPLPPAPTPQSKASHLRKFNPASIRSVRRDPFFAALVECSKEDNGKPASRGISDRFGLGLMVNLNAYSCKRACAVSESIVTLPRSRRALGYDVVSRH